MADGAQRTGSGMPLWVWFAVANAAALAVIAGGLYVALQSQRPAAPSPQQVAKTRTDLANPVELAAAKEAMPAADEPLPPTNTAATEPDLAPVESALKAATPAASPESAEQRSMAAVLEQSGPGVVLLRTQNSEGRDIGQGSGFVIDQRGWVATNFHVLRQASKVRVRFPDGLEVHAAGLRAWDADLDLAILELENPPERLTVLPLSDSTDRPVASLVLAIGHPQGLRQSTTPGIISAVHTTAELPPQFRERIFAAADTVWLQTNAAVTGGSSGGPLLNATGQVIGVNTWVLPQAQLAFAVDARHLRALHAAVGELMTLADVTGPDEHLLRLSLEFNSRYGWFQERLAELTNEQERQSLVETHPSAEFSRKLLELAEQKPLAPAAFDALCLACRIGSVPDAPDVCQRLVARASERLFASGRQTRRMTSFAWMLRDAGSDSGRAVLRRLIDLSDDRQQRGVGTFALAISLSRQLPPNDAAAGEALELLERVMNDYGDVELAGTPLRPIADQFYFEAKYLAIGRVPPEIDGVDQDGNAVRLSALQGRVVVLDFFADWCPHCVQMYPHERDLVEKLKDRPFTLLGINCDQPARLRQLVKSGAVTWPCLADGPEGPITAAYRVESFPTLFVLDREGRIRYRDVRDAALEAAVLQLLAEDVAASALAPDNQ